MIHFLPTDMLFLATVAALVFFGFRSLGDPAQQRAWNRLFQSRVAMVSAVFLVFFTVIGVVDSIRPGPEASSLSLLDQILTPLRTSTERTYSAPLATHSSAHELILLADGREVFERPRLSFGGRHLGADDSARLGDLLRRGILGSLGGFCIALMGIGVMVFLSGHLRGQGIWSETRRLFLGGEGWPLRPVAMTLILLLVAWGAVFSLATGYHVLGTDKVGNDVLYQGLKSIRTGLLIGTLTTLATLPISLTLGVLAGYLGGWVDDAIQFLYTALNAIPGVLLIAASMLVMQAYMASHEAAFQSLSARADFRLLALCLILGITSWTGLCRLLRAETLKIREMEFVQAAKVMGVSEFRILLRHIVPNLSHLVLISVAMDFSSLVLAEAVLSYVNIGVDPSTESWGNMINTARLELAREPTVWWSLATAFMFMFTLVLAANLFADALRDAFDPRGSLK